MTGGEKAPLARLLSAAAFIATALPSVVTYAQTCASLAEAEKWLLGGQPTKALEAIPAEAPSRCRLLAARLEMEAHLLRQDVGAVSAVFADHASLERSAWGRALTRRMGRVRRDRMIQTFGIGLFALTLSILSWGGGRRLLRPNIGTLTLTVSVGGALVWIDRTSPGFLATAVCGGGFLALAHAAVATDERLLLGRRGRAILAALSAMGALGLSLALAPAFVFLAGA